MGRSLLGADRVVLLLSLVPYLREHGPISVIDLAVTFDVDPKLLRRLVAFLGTAGIPGETLSYQHDDLFDIDWDALELHDVVALTHTVAIEETPRFTGVETAALLAGLHALGPVLPEADAALAVSLSARLSEAFGAAMVPSVTVAGVARDERVADFLLAIDQRSITLFTYQNAEGAEEQRTLRPQKLIEREGVWYVSGHDIDRDAERMFRLDRISGLETRNAIEEAEGAAEQAPEQEVTDPHPRDSEIVAVLPKRLLSAIRGFAPRMTQDLGSGRVEVSIDAWHPGAAVRLVQHGPGEIEIVSPLAARAAVSEWAETAISAYGA